MFSSHGTTGLRLRTNQFLVFNARSIINKIPDLNFLLAEKPSGVFVTETWCKPYSVHDATLSYDNAYVVHRCDREGERRGGGILALINKRLRHSLIESKNFSEFCQCLVLQINFQREAVLIIVVYRSPSCSSPALCEFLDFISGVITDWPSGIILVGDLNLPLIDWCGMSLRGGASSFCSQKFIEFCKSNNLIQTVDKPTHGSNILDVVLANEASLIDGMSVLPPFSTSDHNIISFCIRPYSFSDRIPPTSRIIYRNFSKGNFDAINRELSVIDWTSLLQSSNSVESCYNFFTSVCQDLIDRYIPLTYLMEKRLCLPKSVNALRNKVAFLHREISKFGHAKYFSAARRLKRALARLALAREENVACSASRRKLYKYCNTKLNHCTDIPDLKDGDRLIIDDQDKADLFAQYFESVYKPASVAHVPINPKTDKIIDWIDINCETVYRQLKRLPCRNSTSPDGIPYVFLKMAAVGLALPLSLLFSKILLYGQVPKIWKFGLVKPVYKKGVKGFVNNYRPICLTCSTSKVMERLVCEKLTDFLLENKLLSDNQHGFLSKRSTVSALISTVPLWHREVDKGNYVSVCYVDYSKAFDSISINHLFKKISAYGVGGCLYNFIVSCLSHRRQSVLVNNFRSRTLLQVGCHRGRA